MLYLLSRALTRVSFGWIRLVCYYIVVQPASPEKLTRSPSQSSVRCIDDVTDPLVAQFPRPAYIIARRFSDGAICLTSTCRERFAGFLWMAHGSYNEDEVRCRYKLVEPDCSIWDFDVYVEPAFRTSRTFSRLWDAANAYMMEQGILWSFSRISWFNISSLSAHARLGLRRLFSVIFLCFGQVQIAIIGASPFVHISWSDRFPLILHLRVPT